jgi:hypothetical protein
MTKDNNSDDSSSLPTYHEHVMVTSSTAFIDIYFDTSDNFKCRICNASVKDNKGLRLEIHHAKSFNDICNENNITTLKQALACKEIWR